jgi:hypothetical protein
MGYSLLVHTAIGSTDTNGVTTAAVDTTGADLIVATIAYFNGGTGNVFSDSKGNSWSQLTDRTAGDGARIRTFYSQSPATVGTGHTFTFSGTGNFPSLAIAAFRGSLASPFDVENGTTASSVTSLATGNIVPSQDNELIIAALASNLATDTATIDSGMTTTDVIAWASSAHVGVGLAYKIQTTAAAINPTWSWTNAMNAAVEVASFEASPVGTTAAVRQLFVFP